MRLLSCLIAVFLAATVFGQNVILEDKSDNKDFNKKYKDFKPLKMMVSEDGGFLAYYNKSKGGKLQSEYIVKVFDRNLNQLKAVEHELPKKTYVNSILKFNDGKVITFVYAETGNREVELAAVPLSMDNYKLDFDNKSVIGTYKLAKGRSARNAMKSGNLFRFIYNKDGAYVALIGGEESRRSKDRAVNYVILNSEGKIIRSGVHDFKEDTKNIQVNSYSITPQGDLYAVYSDFSRGKRSGAECYAVNIVNGKKNKIGDDAQSLNSPFIKTRDDGSGLVILATYSESKKDNIKGRAQGLYLALLDKNAKLVEELYKPFPKDVLNDIFDGKKSLVKKGNVSIDFDVKLLEENNQKSFSFVIEPHFKTYTYDRFGNVTGVIHHSLSAICGEINPATTDFNWIKVIKKQEKVKTLGAVGSFAYLDADDKLNLIFNYNKEEKGNKKSRGMKYINRNPKSSTIKKVTFDQNGKRSEEDLFRSKKETGMYFIPSNGQWDPVHNLATIILSKRNREMVGVIRK